MNDKWSTEQDTSISGYKLDWQKRRLECSNDRGEGEVVEFLIVHLGRYIFSSQYLESVQSFLFQSLGLSDFFSLSYFSIFTFLSQPDSTVSIKEFAKDLDGRVGKMRAMRETG